MHHRFRTAGIFEKRQPTYCIQHVKQKVRVNLIRKRFELGLMQ